MSKYNSTLTLVETGECLKTDTALRVQFVVETLARAIPEKNRTAIVGIVQDDIVKIIERIAGGAKLV